MAPEVDGIKLPNAYGGNLGTDNSINKASTRLCVRPNGCNKGGFAWCSIFSTAAPKPRAEGSSPSAPAKQKSLRFMRRLFCFTEQRRTRGTRSVPGNACERRLRRIQRAGGWRSGRKNRGEAAARRFFRAPQAGLRSNFEPFCPCHWKSLETAGFQGFFFAFSRAAHGLFCRILMLENGADFPSGGIC